MHVCSLCRTGGRRGEALLSASPRPPSSLSPLRLARSLASLCSSEGALMRRPSGRVISIGGPLPSHPLPLAPLPASPGGEGRVRAARSLGPMLLDALFLLLLSLSFAGVRGRGRALREHTERHSCAFLPFLEAPSLFPSLLASAPAGGER